MHAAQQLHRGMPPLDDSGPPLSHFEFWPMWRFYAPMWPYLGWLMLRYGGVTVPLLSNPGFPVGGLCGESKTAILDMAIRHAPDNIAPFVAIDRGKQPPEQVANQALLQLAAASLALPLVAKPDVSCRGAGVKVIRSEAALVDYLRQFPAGQKLLLQKLIDHDAEAGIFYVRRPDEPRGQIISLTLKYFPHVIGDGHATLRQLIMADARAAPLSHLYLGRHKDRLDSVPAQGEAVRLAFAGSHSRGAIFRDGTHLVTDRMTSAFDAIAQAIPGFFFGRFDVRFTDYHALQRGEGFTILEINGAGAESTHIWDRRITLRQAYAALRKQYRLMFEIGQINRRRGLALPSIRELWRHYRLEKQLVPLYPATE